MAQQIGGMGIVLIGVAAYAILMKKTAVAAPTAQVIAQAKSMPGTSGNQGSDAYVAWIQQSLNQVLGAGLAVDGVMGPETRAWIITFQNTWSITADGIVGPETDYSLRSALGQLGFVDVPYSASGGYGVVQG